MTYVPGDYLVICDRCGFKRLASECKMTWDGWFVCEDTCWEPKHEQFTPPKPLGEKQSVPVRRAEDSLNMVDSVDDSTLEASVTETDPEDGYFITTPITGDDL
ncbi:MAG: hypothetical protein SVO01_00175 [Thermotogota bacterium]|nr:hypothetical protein [Thermotogota bacterium]